MRNLIKSPVLVLVLRLMLSATPFASGADIGDVQNGMRTDEVLALLGKPTGRLSMGDDAILHYPGGEVETRNGVVIAVKANAGHSPSADNRAERPAAPPPDPPAAPKRDLRDIMTRLRGGTGLDCAEAVRLCDGPWAAGAVPLLVNLLDNEEAFAIHTKMYIQGRPAGMTRSPTPTEMRHLAAAALRRIGADSWDPCMRALHTGSPLARAKAADVLNALKQQYAPPASDFPTRLLTVFESRLMDDPRASKARLEMAQTVARQPGPDALAALHRILKNPRNLPIEHTINLLGGRGDPASIPLLTEVLLKHTAESARTLAGAVLLQWEDSADVANAVRSGVKHPDPHVRRHIVQIFQKAPQAVFADDYLRFFQDQDRSVRRQAIQGASHFEAPEVMVALSRILHQERDATIAQDAGGSLVLMTRDVHDERVIEALCKGLQHPMADRRVIFADALGRTGAPAGYECLAETAQHDAEPAVRAMALSRLDNFDNPKSEDILLRALKHESAPRVREAAMQRVKYGSLRHRQEAILLDLVQTGSALQALEAALVMGELDIIHRHPDVLAVLIRALRHDDKQVRAQVVHYLCAEAGIPRLGSEGRELGEHPEKWRAKFGYWVRHPGFSETESND